MKDYQKRPWTILERQLLKERYYLSTAEQLAELFPGRTPNAITKQVNYLRKRGWTFNREKV